VAARPAAPAATPAAADADAERARLGKQVRLVRRLLRVAKPSERFDVQLRLADLCTQMAAVAADDAEHDKWMAESARLYLELASDAAFAKEPHMDSVLFGAGFALMSTGDAKGARMAYLRLVKDYPTSKYIPDVYLAFADYYYEQASMENAQRFYEKVLMFPAAKVYDYAQYKLGWVYFNLQDFPRALESFYRVVTNTRKRNDASARRLAHAATQDLVRAYAEIGKADKAAAFFARVDPDAMLGLLARLGDIYRDQGKLADLVRVRQEHIRRAPSGPHVCRFQSEVAEAALTLGNADRAAQELVRLAELWSRLADAGTLAAEEQAWCGDTTYALLARTARAWHAESEATLDGATRERAILLYQALAAHFANVAEAPAHQYYLADALWRRAAALRDPNAALLPWRDAAQAFERCARIASARDSFFDDALVGAVLAYQNALAIADALGEEQQLLRAEARALFERVVAEHPSSRAAASARRLLSP